MVIMIMMFDDSNNDGGDGDVEDVFSDVSPLILRCGDGEKMVMVLMRTPMVVMTTMMVMAVWMPLEASSGGSLSIIR